MEQELAVSYGSDAHSLLAQDNVLEKLLLRRERPSLRGQNCILFETGDDLTASQFGR